MLLVLEADPCQQKEHEEKEDFDAKVLPLCDVVLRQAIVLQQLQHMQCSAHPSRGNTVTSGPKNIEYKHN